MKFYLNYSTVVSSRARSQEDFWGVPHFPPSWVSCSCPSYDGLRGRNTFNGEKNQTLSNDLFHSALKLRFTHAFHNAQRSIQRKEEDPFVALLWIDKRGKRSFLRDFDLGVNRLKSRVETEGKPRRDPSCTLQFILISPCHVLLSSIHQIYNRANMYVPFAVKSLICQIVSFIPANVDIKFVCGVGTGFAKPNRAFVPPVVRLMGKIHINSQR